MVPGPLISAELRHRLGEHNEALQTHDLEAIAFLADMSPEKLAPTTALYRNPALAQLVRELEPVWMECTGRRSIRQVISKNER